MHEQIAAAVVGRDEAIALFVVEPLDGPGCHLRVHPSSRAPVRCPARARATWLLLDDRSRSGRRGNATSHPRGFASAARPVTEALQRPSKVAFPGPSARNVSTARWRSSVANSGA